MGRCAAPARVRRYEHFCAAKISAQGGFISPGAFLMTGLPQKQRFCGTEAFRFASPFGIPLPTGQGRGLRPPPWIQPPGARFAEGRGKSEEGRSDGQRARQASGSGKRSRGHKFVPQALHLYKHLASERADGERRGKSSLYQTAPACHLAQAHLIEARYWLGFHPSPSFSFAPGAARFFFSCREKKKWGAHNGQENKSLPCRRKR